MKKSPIKELIKELKSDKDYYIGWQSNIAMAFIDNYYFYKRNKNKKYLSGKRHPCYC